MTALLAVDADSSASWRGRVALGEADARPGRYYVTARDERGRHAFLLGPYVQPTYGKEAHARALAEVRVARRIVEDLNLNPFAALTFGTCWTPLYGSAVEGKLNGYKDGGLSDGH